MTRNRRLFGLVAVLLAAGAVAGGVAYAVGRSDDDSAAERRSERAFTEAHVDQAAVTQAQAEAAALDAHPGTVIESELENEGNGLVWEVEIDDGTTVREVAVDAKTGRVTGTDVEGSEGSDGE